MMEATGILAVGESSTAMAYIKARRGVSPRQMKAILLISMLVVGIPLSAWVSGSWLAAMLSVEFAIVGLAVGLLAVQWSTGPAMRRALAERGRASEQTLTFRLTPEALIYDLTDLTMTARWPCVTDLYRTPKHWVFLVQSSAMILPRRFFPEPGLEREFIAEAMSRMTEAARARSPDALKVVGR
ncbi:MAG: YcxB family protein [Caulobacterales bacterium]|nr:YcxB family protein [Caulobacterales bacterium]